MDCHATKQNQADNHPQQLNRSLKSSLVTLMTITLQLDVSSKKLHNKRAIVREGTGYPSRHTPISVMVLE